MTGQSVMPFDALHPMNNWGFYHYFFARILFFLGNNDNNFVSLLRSKKQSSFILCPIDTDEIEEASEDAMFYKRQESVANYVLIRRTHVEQFNNMATLKKLKFLARNKYLPEMRGEVDTNDINSFIEKRDIVLGKLVNDIWDFK